jgi:predicted negative regulator of RcsB-dependent stress response
VEVCERAACDSIDFYPKSCRGGDLAHISRKELKTDEVRDTLAHGAEAVLSHQQLTIYLLALAIVVALGVFGWRLYSERQDVKASAAYDVAMQSFSAPVATAAQAAQTAGELTFPDDKSKYTDSAAKFTSVANSYPHTHDGALAKYFAAVSDEHLAKDDDAKRLLADLASDSDPDFAAMGKFELAQIDNRTGQGDAAAKLYQELIDKPTVLVPKSVAMLALAQHYVQSDPAQASKLFSQIKTDYPDTPIAEQADQGLSMIPGKS